MDQSMFEFLGNININTYIKIEKLQTNLYFFFKEINSRFYSLYNIYSSKL